MQHHSPVSDADDESGALPVTHHDDYRPFIRRLPEYSFWLGTCKASMVAFLMTFLSFLDIPVFWYVSLVLPGHACVQVLKPPPLLSGPSLPCTPSSSPTCF